MMTIKHITLRGEEFVYPTTHVNYVPASALNLTSTPKDTPPDTLWRYDADGHAHPVTGGTVFVMNEHGKTVSRYDLGASNVPFTGDGANKAFASS